MEEEYLKKVAPDTGPETKPTERVSHRHPEEQRIDQSLEADIISHCCGGFGIDRRKGKRAGWEISGEFFPQTAVQVIERRCHQTIEYHLTVDGKGKCLKRVVPDVHLVATLMSLSRVIPEKNKEMALQVVRKVVDELLRKLSAPTQQAVTGALNRSARRRNPRYNEIDWKTTITKNLKNYQPEYKTIIPEVRIG